MKIKHRHAFTKFVVKSAKSPIVMRQSRFFDGQMRIVEKKTKSVTAMIALIDETTKLLTEILTRADVAQRHHNLEFVTVGFTGRAKGMRSPVEKTRQQPRKGSCYGSACSS